MPRVRTTNIGLFLHLAGRNISELRRLSETTGLPCCSIGRLEAKQAELEHAFYAKSNGNLGFFQIPLAVWGVGAFVSYMASLGAAVWWHYTNVKNEKAKQENIKVAMEKGIDPGTFCPATPISPTEKLIETIRGVIILGAVGMLIIMLMKRKK